MPRMHRRFSEAVPGATKLDTLLKKVKASGVSAVEGIGRQAVNSINLRRKNVMLQKTSRTWILSFAVVCGCTFGFGLSFHQRGTPRARGKYVDVGGQEESSSGPSNVVN